VYDGWNMIAEFTLDAAAGVGGTAGAAPVSVGEMRLRRSYAWGYDVSGTLTGAGGVGGLLLLRDYGSAGNQTLTLAPLYDWNGNVMGYADVATGQVRHRFEYDPFGQELSVDSFVSAGAGGSISTHSSPPPVRFSSKYTDAETGLVYYGYRSYSPQLGRWISRDPIEERGGTNLYGMLGNDPVNAVDVLGLKRPSRCNRNRCGWEGPGGPTGAPRRLPDYNPGESNGWSNLEEVIDTLFGGEEGWARTREKRRWAACYEELAKLTLDDRMCMSCCTVLVGKMGYPISATLHEETCAEVGKDGYWVNPGNSVIEYKL
jgi:RHS repeat-associated protein